MADVGHLEVGCYRVAAMFTTSNYKSLKSYCANTKLRLFLTYTRMLIVLKARNQMQQTASMC